MTNAERQKRHRLRKKRGLVVHSVEIPEGCESKLEDYARTLRDLNSGKLKALADAVLER